MQKKETRQWLIDRRRDFGLTQEDLAVQVGVTRQQISFIELGGSPAVSTAKRIAGVLAFPWTDFFESTAS